MNAVAAAPPPSLMHKGTVRRVEQAVGKRHTAMGTGIVHREWLTLVVATEGKWSFEQHGPAQLLLREFATGRGTIPEAIQHYGIGRLGLWKGLVCHNPD